MNEYSHKYKINSLLMVLFFLLTCAGCVRASGYYIINLTGYNHTEGSIAYFSARVGEGKGGGEGYLGAGTGGGSMTCCIQVPEKWKKNLKATVKFNISLEGIDREITKEVFVPEYTKEDAGHVSVHFLFDGSVKVFITQYALGHRKYPLRGNEAELKQGVPIDIIWE
jgi:hypothetical protein